MPLSSLLFDLDGTLLETETGILGCFHRTLEALGLPQKPDPELRRFIGPPLQEAWKELVGGEYAGEAAAIYRDCYATTGKFGARPYDGILEALARLSPSYRLFIATSKRQSFALEMAEHFGLRPHLAEVYGLLPEHLSEDKTSLIGRILRDQNLHPPEALMIGDRRYDLIGARANGIDSIGVLWGYGTREELEAHGPTLLCERPQDLPDLIARMPIAYGP
jgi:phosphoglycolate phosphatase